MRYNEKQYSWCDLSPRADFFWLMRNIDVFFCLISSVLGPEAFAFPKTLRFLISSWKSPNYFLNSFFCYNIVKSCNNEQTLKPGLFLTILLNCRCRRHILSLPSYRRQHSPNSLHQHRMNNPLSWSNISFFVSWYPDTNPLPCISGFCCGGILIYVLDKLNATVSKSKILGLST